MCQTPRVNPKVVVSSKVGLKVCVSLIANAWALFQPTPPAQGSVKFLKQSRPPPVGLYWYANFALIKLLLVKRWSILISNCLLELLLEPDANQFSKKLPPVRLGSGK